jgi:hypothetical protein
MISVIYRSFVCAVFVMISSASMAREDWQRATIYYYDWDVEVRSDLTVENVRQHFYTKIDIAHADEAGKFANVIEAKNFQPGPSPRGIDVRLVIDLYSSGGKRTTYFASYFRLYSEDRMSSVEIDNSFRSRFRIAD